MLQAIRQRADRLAGGGGRDDGKTLALVVEGGAMRAVQSAGGAVALARLRFGEVFDQVYTTSAGTMNAAYLITDQPDIGITVYYDSCASRRFINPWRFWRILDVDWLFDHVVRHEKPLDVSRLLRSPTRMFVTMLDYDTGESVLVDVQQSTTEPLDIFKAATAMPVFYNRPVLVEGRRCIDGGLLNPFPLRAAIDRGCTDILVLLTQPPDFVRGPSSRFETLVFDTLCARGRAPLCGLLTRYPEVDKRFRDLALNGGDPAAGARIATMTPRAIAGLGQTTIDPEALWRAADLYGRDVLAAFGAEGELLRLPRPARIRRGPL